MRTQLTRHPHTIGGTPDDKAENVEIGEGDIIRVDSQLVTLNISVIDRSTSRGLAGLVQSDFQLFEDGQEQRIVQFDSSSAPFDLVLLIDLSGSTKEVVKLIRAAALRFVNAARPADRIAVITFAGSSSIVSGLTADRDLLRQKNRDNRHSAGRHQALRRDKLHDGQVKKTPPSRVARPSW